MADLVLSAETRAAIEDAGFVVVPAEPTAAMLRAACKAMSPGRRPAPDRVSAREKHAIRYRAMISAASSGDATDRMATLEDRPCEAGAFVRVACRPKQAPADGGSNEA